MSWLVVLISTIAYASGAGTGILLWNETGSEILLVVSVFLPLVLYACIHSFELWKLNDYQFYVPGKSVSVWLIVDTVLTVLLILSMGFTLALLVSPVIGYSLTAGILQVGLTFVGLFQWFHSYQFRWSLVVMGILATGIFGGGVAAIWMLVLRNNPTTFVPFVCGVFLYPIFVLSLATAYKFADDNYKVSTALKYYITVDLVLWVSFSAVLMYILPDPTYGASLFTLVFICVISLILPRLAQTVWVKVAYAAVILAVLGLAVYLGTEDQHFLAYSISVAVAWLCLLGVTLKKHSHHFATLAEKLGLKQYDTFSNLTELNSPDIFPVYKFITTPGAASPLKENNSRVIFVGYLLTLSLVWGLSAVYFVEPLAVGLGAIAVSVVLMVWYILETTTEPLVLFAAAVRLYEGGENSPAYLNALEQAKSTVAMCQGYLQKVASPQTETATQAENFSPLLTESLDELDWQSVRDAKRRLDRQIPSVFSCKKVSNITFRNSFSQQDSDYYEDDNITLQQALHLLLYLDNLTCARYSNRSKFITHVQLEMIRASQAVQSERKRKIINCLNSMVDTKDQALEELSAPRLFQLATAELKEIQARKERLKKRHQEQRSEQLRAHESRMKVQSEQVRDVEEEIKKMIAIGQTWTDTAFPPTSESIIRNKKPTGKYSRWVNYPWFRAGAIGTPEATEKKDANLLPVFKDIDPSVIQQGELGDCYVLSALSVLSQYPDVLKNLIDIRYKEHGIYKVNFFHGGEQISVFVDDHFPSKDGKVPLFARSTDSSLWVMLLEKAYAKLYGSYEIIESGFVDQALIDLTGGSGSRIDMTKPQTKQKIRNGLLWDVMLDYYSQGYLMGAGSPSGNEVIVGGREPVSSFGIVQGHAYAVLHVVQIDGHRLIQLKNPWGKIEWKGDWSDNSPCWNARLRAKIKLILQEKGKQMNTADVEDDGIFWMDFLDFTMHFEDVYVCRLFGPDRWISQPVIFDEWKIGRDAGGCSNFRTVKTSPQFLLIVKNPDTSIVICLAQQDVRGLQKELVAIAIEVYNNHGQLIHRGKTGELIATNPESYIYRREVLCETVLSPLPRGKGDGYTVLIAPFEKDVERKYTLQVFSSKPIEFVRLSADAD